MSSSRYSLAAHGLERLAADAAVQFQDQHLRVRNSSVVHVVGWYRWFGELRLPGPACGTGWAGAAVLGELHAVAPAFNPVTCRKCPTPAVGDHADTPEQCEPWEQLALALDEPPEDELALFSLDHGSPRSQD